MTEPLADDSVLTEVSVAAEVQQLHGFASPQHGPLAVLVTETDQIFVYDASAGRELSRFPADRGASHVYEDDAGTFLVVAADGELRRWELPGGEPFGGPIEVPRQTVAVTTYREAGRTVLVVVDAYGVVRRLTEGGGPIGAPLRLVRQPRFRPPRARLHRGSSTVAWDGGSALWVAGQHEVWRIEFGPQTVTRVEPRTDGLIMNLAVGPAGLVLAPDDGLLLMDADGGTLREVRYARHPKRDYPAYTDSNDIAGFAVGPDGRAFAALGASVVSWAGEDAVTTVLDPHVTNPQSWISDLCVVPVGDRIALLATDCSYLYRYDALTLKPWPLG